MNAHPHASEDGKFAVVHNGIIENYMPLKEELIAKGYHFKSETDTEVVAHLLEDMYDGDFVGTVRRMLNRVDGAYALEIICACLLYTSAPSVQNSIYSYEPGVVNCDLHDCLPPFVTSVLERALPYWGRRIRGFDNPAVCMTCLLYTSIWPPQTMPSLTATSSSR